MQGAFNAVGSAVAAAASGVVSALKLITTPTEKEKRGEHHRPDPGKPNAFEAQVRGANTKTPMRTGNVPGNTTSAGRRAARRRAELLARQDAAAAAPAPMFVPTGDKRVRKVAVSTAAPAAVAAAPVVRLPAVVAAAAAVVPESKKAAPAPAPAPALAPVPALAEPDAAAAATRSTQWYIHYASQSSTGKSVLAYRGTKSVPLCTRLAFDRLVGYAAEIAMDAINKEPVFVHIWTMTCELLPLLQDVELPPGSQLASVASVTEALAIEVLCLIHLLFQFATACELLVITEPLVQIGRFTLAQRDIFHTSTARKESKNMIEKTKNANGKCIDVYGYYTENVDQTRTSLAVLCILACRQQFERVRALLACRKACGDWTRAHSLLPDDVKILWNIDGTESDKRMEFIAGTIQRLKNTQQAAAVFQTEYNTKVQAIIKEFDTAKSWNDWNVQKLPPHLNGELFQTAFHAASQKYDDLKVFPVFNQFSYMTLFDQVPGTFDAWKSVALPKLANVCINSQYEKTLAFARDVTGINMFNEIKDKFAEIVLIMSSADLSKFAAAFNDINFERPGLRVATKAKNVAAIQRTPPGVTVPRKPIIRTAPRLTSTLGALNTQDKRTVEQLVSAELKQINASPGKKKSLTLEHETDEMRDIRSALFDEPSDEEEDVEEDKEEDDDDAAAAVDGAVAQGASVPANLIDAHGWTRPAFGQLLARVALTETRNMSTLQNKLSDGLNDDLTKAIKFSEEMFTTMSKLNEKLGLLIGQHWKDVELIDSDSECIRYWKTQLHCVRYIHGDIIRSYLKSLARCALTLQTLSMYLRHKHRHCMVEEAMFAFTKAAKVKNVDEVLTRYYTRRADGPLSRGRDRRFAKTFQTASFLLILTEVRKMQNAFSELANTVEECLTNLGDVCNFMNTKNVYEIGAEVFSTTFNSKDVHTWKSDFGLIINGCTLMNKLPATLAKFWSMNSRLQEVKKAAFDETLMRKGTWEISPTAILSLLVTTTKRTGVHAIDWTTRPLLYGISKLRHQTPVLVEEKNVNDYPSADDVPFSNLSSIMRSNSVTMNAVNEFSRNLSNTSVVTKMSALLEETTVTLDANKGGDFQYASNPMILKFAQLFDAWRGMKNVVAVHYASIRDVLQRTPAATSWKERLQTQFNVKASVQKPIKPRVSPKVQRRTFALGNASASRRRLLAELRERLPGSLKRVNRTPRWSASLLKKTGASLLKKTGASLLKKTGSSLPGKKTEKRSSSKQKAVLIPTYMQKASVRTWVFDSRAQTQLQPKARPTAVETLRTQMCLDELKFVESDRMLHIRSHANLDAGSAPPVARLISGDIGATVAALVNSAPVQILIAMLTSGIIEWPISKCTDNGVSTLVYFLQHRLQCSRYSDIIPILQRFVHLYSHATFGTELLLSTLCTSGTELFDVYLSRGEITKANLQREIIDLADAFYTDETAEMANSKYVLLRIHAFVDDDEKDNVGHENATLDNMQHIKFALAKTIKTPRLTPLAFVCLHGQQHFVLPSTDQILESKHATVTHILAAVGELLTPPRFRLIGNIPTTRCHFCGFTQHAESRVGNQFNAHLLLKQPRCIHTLLQVAYRSEPDFMCPIEKRFCTDYDIRNVFCTIVGAIMNLPVVAAIRDSIQNSEVQFTKQQIDEWLLRLVSVLQVPIAPVRGSLCHALATSPGIYRITGKLLDIVKRQAAPAFRMFSTALYTLSNAESVTKQARIRVSYILGDVGVCVAQLITVNITPGQMRNVRTDVAMSHQLSIADELLADSRLPIQAVRGKYAIPRTIHFDGGVHRLYYRRAAKLIHVWPAETTAFKVLTGDDDLPPTRLAAASFASIPRDLDAKNPAGDSDSIPAAKPPNPIGSGMVSIEELDALLGVLDGHDMNARLEYDMEEQLEAAASTMQ